MRDENVKMLPLYEEPTGKKKKVVVPMDMEVSLANVSSSDTTKSLKSISSSSKTEPKLEPILMPAPEDLFTLHLDLVKSLHHRAPDHDKALQIMSKILKTSGFVIFE